MYHLVATPRDSAVEVLQSDKFFVEKDPTLCLRLNECHNWNGNTIMTCRIQEGDDMRCGISKGQTLRCSLKCNAFVVASACDGLARY